MVFIAVPRPISNFLAMPYETRMPFPTVCVAVAAPVENRLLPAEIESTAEWNHGNLVRSLLGAPCQQQSSRLRNR